MIKELTILYLSFTVVFRRSILFLKIFFGFGLAHLLAFIVDWQQKKIIWMYYNSMSIISSGHLVHPTLHKSFTRGVVHANSDMHVGATLFMSFSNFKYTILSNLSTATSTSAIIHWMPITTQLWMNLN